MSSYQPLFEDLMERVEGEYREMPGLRLTVDQARRLWGLDRATCDRLLQALVDRQFLWRLLDDSYVRWDLSRERRVLQRDYA